MARSSTRTRPAQPQTQHPAFVETALGWLLEAQHPGGGYGAGSHARQNVRNPHEVQTDPATTAFTAMALLRAGYLPIHDQAIRRAAEHLVDVVKNAPDGAQVTTQAGTQPQAKLGGLVDTSMTAQFLARYLPTLGDDDPIRADVDAALDRCITKLAGSQHSDGSWGRGGWAPVLQSSLSFSALEYAQVSGKVAGREALRRARENQKANYDVTTNTASAGEAAGVELYSFASSQRAAASESLAAHEEVERAKQLGTLDADDEVNAENLTKAGISGKKARRLADAYAQHRKQVERLDDERMISGFGSNGGEEFLSYLLTSESLVIHGGEAWTQWNEKMHRLLEKVQCPDGSWTGHHCITSPVFCTAAVVQCLTAERDVDLLKAVARAATAGDEKASA